MFRVWIILLSLGWLILASVLALCVLSSQPLPLHTQLETFLEPANHENNGAMFPSFSQNRTHVSRQLLRVREGERLESRMHCQHSLLYLTKTEEKPEWKEKLVEMSCIFQERFLEKESLVCQVAASEALYQYRKQLLTAERAFVKHYRLPDHDWHTHLLPFSPILSGETDHLKLDFFPTKGSS